MPNALKELAEEMKHAFRYDKYTYRLDPVELYALFTGKPVEDLRQIVNGSNGRPASQRSAAPAHGPFRDIGPTTHNQTPIDDFLNVPRLPDDEIALAKDAATADKESQNGTLQETLSNIRYRQPIITIDDLDLDHSFDLTLTKYCPKTCSFCVASALLLKPGQKKEPGYVISNDDMVKFLKFCDGNYSDTRMCTITGDGEPFLEFDKLLHVLSKIKVAKLIIKTNGFWGTDRAAIDNYLKQITKAVETNTYLKSVTIDLSADDEHDNTDAAVRITDAYLEHRKAVDTEIVGDKLRVNIYCAAGNDFSDYYDRFKESVERQGMVLDVIKNNAIASSYIIYKESPAKGLVYWVPYAAKPIGRGYRSFDDIREAWIGLYDFLDKAEKEIGAAAPFNGAPPQRDPLIRQGSYEKTGLPLLGIGCRYNGSIAPADAISPLMAIGSIGMSEDEWLSNANNNPFLRAIKENTMNDLLEAVGKVRPDLTAKIPFGVSDIQVMDWLLRQSDDLTRYILMRILSKDRDDGKLTEKSANAVKALWLSSAPRSAAQKPRRPFGPKAATGDGNPETNRSDVLQAKRDAADKARMAEDVAKPAEPNVAPLAAKPALGAAAAGDRVFQSDTSRDALEEANRLPQRLEAALSVIGRFENRDFNIEVLHKKVAALINYHGQFENKIHSFVRKSVLAMAYSAGRRKPDNGRILGLAGEISGLYEVLIKRSSSLKNINLGRLESLDSVVNQKGESVKEFDAVSDNTVFEFKFHLTLCKLYQQVIGIDSAHTPHLKVLTNDKRFNKMRNIVYFGEADDGQVSKTIAKFIELRPDLKSRVLITPEGGVSIRLTLPETKDFLYSPQTIACVREEERIHNRKFLPKDFPNMYEEMARLIDAKMKQLNGERFDVIISVSKSAPKDLERVRKIIMAASDISQTTETAPLGPFRNIGPTTHHQTPIDGFLNVPTLPDDEAASGKSAAATIKSENTEMAPKGPFPDTAISPKTLFEQFKPLFFGFHEDEYYRKLRAESICNTIRYDYSDDDVIVCYDDKENVFQMSFYDDVRFVMTTLVVYEDTISLSAKFDPERKNIEFDEVEKEKRGKRWDFRADIPVEDLSGLEIHKTGNHLSIDLSFAEFPWQARRILRKLRNTFTTKGGSCLKITEKNGPPDYLWDNPCYYFRSNKNIFSSDWEEITRAQKEPVHFTESQKDALELAKKNYRREVTAAEEGFKRDNNFYKLYALLFRAYYRLNGTITTVLDRDISTYIYPVPGPDITFQTYAPTFSLNDDSTDAFLGRQLLEDSGTIGSINTHEWDNDPVYNKLLSKRSLDAYDLESYYDIERKEGAKLVFVMKGFMYIAQQHYLKSKNERDEFLTKLLNNFLQVGDQIIVLTQEDQDALDSLPQFSEHYNLTYRDDEMLEETTSAYKGHMPIRQVLIPKRIAIYEKTRGDVPFAETAQGKGAAAAAAQNILIMTMPYGYEKPAWLTESDKMKLDETVRSLKPVVKEIIGTLPVEERVLYHKLYGFVGHVRPRSITTIWDEANAIEKSQSFDWNKLNFWNNIIVGKCVYCNYTDIGKGYAEDEELPMLNISFRGTFLDAEKQQKIRDQIVMAIKQFYTETKEDDERFAFMEGYIFDSLAAQLGIDSVELWSQMGIKNPRAILSISIVNRSARPNQASALPGTAPRSAAPAHGPFRDIGPTTHNQTPIDDFLNVPQLPDDETASASGAAAAADTAEPVAEAFSEANPAEWLMGMRENEELLAAARSEEGMAAPSGVERLEAVGVVEKAPDGYRLTPTIRGQDSNHTTAMINLVDDVMKKFNEKSPEFVKEMIRAYMVDYVYGKVKTAEGAEESQTIRIWQGYGAKRQQRMMKDVATKTDGRIQFERSMDELIRFATLPKNMNKGTVTILPREKLNGDQKKALDDAVKNHAQIIYIDLNKENLGDDELGQIEGLIGVGRSYLNDDDESFYKLYTLLVEKPESVRKSLAELKTNPNYFIDQLKFVLRPIKAHDLNDLPRLNRELKKLLESA
ncbi:MAG: hypothetical protein WC738_06805 [Candidatus Omnitrophota bacterium]